MIDVVKQLVGIGTPPVERRLAWWVDNFRFKMERAIARLQSGEWDLPTFQAFGRQEIKDTLYGIAETGAGRRLTRKEIYQVREIYKEQVGYWDRFAKAIEEQRKALAERGLEGDELEAAWNALYAKFDRRAQSYYGAIEAEGLKWVLAQNEGRWYRWTLRPAEHCVDCVEREGEVHQVKDGRLPYYPKDGSTQCLYNCLCYWKPVLKPPSGKRKLGPMGARQRGRKLAEKPKGKK